LQSSWFKDSKVIIFFAVHKPGPGGIVELDLNQVIAHANATFGDSGKAARWLETPNRVLGGLTPIEVASSGVDGLRRVDQILGRIDYGIYS
jgi:uncharacterized protein (DUF2384 family)